MHRDNRRPGSSHGVERPCRALPRYRFWLGTTGSAEWLAETSKNFARQFAVAELRAPNLARKLNIAAKVMP